MFNHFERVYHVTNLTIGVVYESTVLMSAWNDMLAEEIYTKNDRVSVKLLACKPISKNWKRLSHELGYDNSVLNLGTLRNMYWDIQCRQDASTKVAPHLVLYYEGKLEEISILMKELEATDTMIISC